MRVGVEECTRIQVGQLLRSIQDRAVCTVNVGWAPARKTFKYVAPGCTGGGEGGGGVGGGVGLGLGDGGLGGGERSP